MTKNAIEVDARIIPIPSYRNRFLVLCGKCEFDMWEVDTIEAPCDCCDEMNVVPRLAPFAYGMGLSSEFAFLPQKMECPDCGTTNVVAVSPELIDGVMGVVIYPDDEAN